MRTSSGTRSRWRRSRPGDQGGAGIVEPFPADHFSDGLRGFVPRRRRHGATDAQGRGGAGRAQALQHRLCLASSRQIKQQFGGIVGTFAFAIIIVFLALAAQIRASAIPLIILVSVPLSIAGAMLFIMSARRRIDQHLHRGRTCHADGTGEQTRYSDRGIRQRSAARRQDPRGDHRGGASIRLRPILMTTAAMVLGVVPLSSRVGPTPRPAQHMARDRGRSIDWHVVHALRRAGFLPWARQRWRTRRRGGVSTSPSWRRSPPPWGRGIVTLSRRGSSPPGNGPSTPASGGFGLDRGFVHRRLAPP